MKMYTRPRTDRDLLPAMSPPAPTLYKLLANIILPTFLNPFFSKLPPSLPDFNCPSVVAFFDPRSGVLGLRGLLGCGRVLSIDIILASGADVCFGLNVGLRELFTCQVHIMWASLSAFALTTHSGFLAAISCKDGIFLSF